MSQDPISLQDAYTEAVAEIERLRGLLALHEDARLHAIDRAKSRPGIDPCEVAAAVQTLRSIEVVNNVLALVGSWRECPFRYGFEQACEEIEFRLRNDEGDASQDCARTKGGNA